MLGIADDEVADFLRAKADALQLIGCANAALLELLAQDLARDRAPRDPHAGDEDQEEQQQSEDGDRDDSPPSASADDDRFAVPPFFAPP